MLVEEAGGRCAVCGYERCAVALHFHHVDPTTKLFAVNMARGKSLAAYRAEAEKCVLLCANCHAEVETGMIASPPPQARFGESWETLTRTRAIEAASPQTQFSSQLHLTVEADG
jgi:cytochrome c553